MTAESVADILDETNQVIEDTFDLMESRISWLNSKTTLITLSGVTGLAIGASVTYLLAAKRLEKRYQRRSDEEIEDVRAHYALRYKEGPENSLAAVASRHKSQDSDTSGKAVAEAIVMREGYVAYDKIQPNDSPEETPTTVRDLVTTEPEFPEPPAEEVVLVPEERNIFESDDPEAYWDWAEETTRREERPDEPYVITLDEFNENEEDYNQVTLTYYDGDEILCDDQDQPIADEEGTVGSANLLRFGHASNDRNVVYVCNNKLQVYFEVVRNDGKFVNEVLGGIRHSADPRIQRRMRNSDE